VPAIARLVYRQQRRGAVVWGSVFALFAWVSAYGYGASYPKAADRLTLARTLGSNVGIQALFGPARHLETIPGFVAWRCVTLFTVIGAVWGLLLATKVLRGDEEAGRAELLYAGPVTRAGGLAHCLVGIAAVLGVLFATVASSVVVVGLVGGYWSWTASLWFSVAACAGAVFGAAIGALASQLTATRRAASATAGGVVAAAFVVRAIGASVADARWVLRASPISWIDDLRPLTGSSAAALLPIVALVAAATAGATMLARQRDIGGAVLPRRDTADAHTLLLGSTTGLALRLLRGTAVAWAVGVALASAMFGIVSSSVSDALASNKSASDIFARLGSELSAKGYVGLTFVMTSGLLAVSAAVFVNATRNEEGEGRLEQLSAEPVVRWRWLLGRVAVAAVALVVIGVAAGIGGWIGERASGGHISLASMLGAGFNIAPPAVLTLGIGTLAHGVRPRVASTVAYAVVAWSFLLEMLGGVVKFNHVLLDLSFMHHLAAAPLAAPRWDASVVMLVVGALGAVGGAVALERRDLQFS
jgi:ABC-2 type transport system permease protein